jgi:hypothetical protein
MQEEGVAQTGHSLRQSETFESDTNQLVQVYERDWNDGD